jgi:phage terminase large subunit
MTEIDVEFAEVFTPLIETPKRIKIAVGGRGSTKSTFIADYFLIEMMKGHLVGCGREYQNSIDESVHRLMYEEYARLGLSGFTHNKQQIEHVSGGRNFYRGLQGHSIDSIKSMLTGVKKFWVEEGGALSDATLRTLTGSIRLSASEVEAVNRGETVEMPEIWISMNRGKSTDPISRRLLKRAEPDLKRHGIYEDDLVLVVQANYNDIPRSWFLASGLEQERLDDEKNLDQAEYDHKWNGHYSDTVENAIIKPAWFDACIDAHVKLGFKPTGQDVVTHDPADSGDARARAHRKGSVFLDVSENTTDDINDALDWACNYAIDNIADLFIWDGDGVGLGLRRDVSNHFDGKHTQWQMFNGGATCYAPDAVYETLEDEAKGGKRVRKNRDAFYNAIAQAYWLLAQRMEKTYRAVTKGEYINPDELISFSSDIEALDVLRAELCSVPKKPNSNGKFQLVPKKDREEDSPNMGDTCAMSMIAGFINVNDSANEDIYIPQTYSAFSK